MLTSVQRFRVSDFGIERRLWSIYAEGLWMHILRQRGMGADEKIFPGLGFGRPQEGRNLVGIVLRGRTFVRGPRATHEHVAGDVAFYPGRAACRSGIETSEDESFSVTIETDLTVHPAPVYARACASAGNVEALRREVEDLCAAIETAWRNVDATPAVYRALAQVFDLLRAQGIAVPFLEPGAPHGVHAHLHHVGRAVDLALSNVNERAMLVDVESACGMSARTVQRAFPALCAAWGHRSESFREHTRRVQITRACYAMTSPRATTGGVARALGFSTPNAFCRAMASYGLPSPGGVRAALHALI